MKSPLIGGIKISSPISSWRLQGNWIKNKRYSTVTVGGTIDSCSCGMALLSKATNTIVFHSGCGINLSKA